MQAFAVMLVVVMWPGVAFGQSSRSRPGPSRLRSPIAGFDRNVRSLACWFLRPHPALALHPLPRERGCAGGASGWIGLILPRACAIYSLIFREALSSRLPEILRSSASFKFIYANQPHS